MHHQLCIAAIETVLPLRGVETPIILVLAQRRISRIFTLFQGVLHPLFLDMPRRLVRQWPRATAPAFLMLIVADRKMDVGPSPGPPVTAYVSTKEWRQR
jgi:hypothetical protein